MDLPPIVVHEIVIDHQQAAARHLSEMSPAALDHDWKLDEFFGCVYVINLPQAKARLNAITQDLHRIGMRTFEVFQAVDGRKDLKPEIWRKFCKNWQNFNLKTNAGREKFDRQRKGEAGCFMSHYRLMRMVKLRYDQAMVQMQEAEFNGDEQQAAMAAKKMRKYSSVLILEDDNGFGIVDTKTKDVLHADCGTVLRQAMQELPADWDMLYFTFMSREDSAQYSPNLLKITQTYGTHAYAVNHTMYHTLVKYLKKIEQPSVRYLVAIDVQLAKIFPGRRIFAITPSIAYQCSGKSFITGKEKDNPIQYIY